MDLNRQNAGGSLDKTQGRLDKYDNSLKDWSLEETGIKTRVPEKERRGEPLIHLHNSLARNNAYQVKSCQIKNLHQSTQRNKIGKKTLKIETGDGRLEKAGACQSYQS